MAAQKEAVARLAKHGAILSEFTEIESGKNHTNRPQLIAALAEAKRRRATLLIAKLDRLARNVHFISGLMESGVDFIAGDLPQANKLTIHIIAAIAEHERELISQRTYAAFDQAKKEIAEKGFRISKRSGKAYTKHGNPRWQECIGKARAARKQEQQAPLPIRLPHAVQRIHELKAEGLALRAIAAKLNEEGIRTSKGFGAWHASTVNATLKLAA